MTAPHINSAILRISHHRLDALNKHGRRLKLSRLVRLYGEGVAKEKTTR